MLIIVICCFALSGCATRKPEELQVTVGDNDRFYLVNDSFNKGSLKVTVVMSDGEKVELSEGDYTLSTPDMRKSGKQKVTVTYKDLSYDYTVTIMEKVQNDGDQVVFSAGKVSLTCYLVGNNKPFALICPGGGYVQCSTDVEGYPFGEAFNEKGYNAFVLKYSMREGKNFFPQPIDDVAMAINLIMRNSDEFNVATDNYVVVGSSAGGHLAASWNVEQWGYKKYGLPKPVANILCYPSLTKYEYEVLKNVSQSFCPAYIWGCENDNVVNFNDNGVALSKLLEEQGILYQLNTVYEVYGETHGIGLAKGTKAEGWFDEAVAFWESQIK